MGELSGKKVTVTGGAGYVGSILVPLLIEAGAEVTLVVDNLMFAQPKPNFAPSINFMQADLRNDETFQQAIAPSDFIVHLTALVGEPACRKDPELSHQINVELTDKLNQARQGIPTIFFSSTSIYGEKSGAVCDENFEPKPTEETPYSLHKFMAEKLIAPSDNWIIFRPATAFGYSPRQRLDILINSLTYQALKKRKIELFNPDFNRTFIHVKDLARAVIWALTNFEQHQRQIFNIGANELNISKRQIAEILKTKLDFELTINDSIIDPDLRNFIINYDKLEQAGFKTTISLEAGIEEMIAAFGDFEAQPHNYNTNY